MPKQIKPMQVTKGNITRVLTQAGYPKWSYRGMELFPGTDVEEAVDAETGETLLCIVHKVYFGCVSASSDYALNASKPEFYEAQYAEVLTTRFTVRRRKVSAWDYYREKGELWAVFPLNAPAPPAHETQEAEDE